MKAIWGRLRREWDSCAIGLAVFLFHLCHVPAVARAQVFQRDNLAFDLDITRFVSLWGGPTPTEQNPAYYAVRHPLVILLRLFGRPLVAGGLEARLVAGGIAALCAALSSVLMFRIALTLGVRRTTAYVTTAMWSFSTVSLLLGVLPETYGVALVALLWQMLIAARWAQGHRPVLATRIAAAVVNLGVTVTNVVLSGLVELVFRLVRQPLRKALLATTAFSASVAAIGLVLSAASFLIWPVGGIDSGGHAARQLYWSASSANRGEARQSPAEVAWTFGAIAFAAPAVAAYPSGAPEDPYLYDLRGRDYTPIGWIAVLGWLALLLPGAVAAARDRAMRPLWIVAATWIAGTIALHSYWQFRQAVFLYAAHAAIAIFVVALAGARWTQERHRHGAPAYAAAAGLVTLLLILNNMPLYLALPELH